jgi:hypothetical protein
LNAADVRRLAMALPNAGAEEVAGRVELITLYARSARRAVAVDAIHAGGPSGYCGRSSVISNHGAFDAT